MKTYDYVEYDLDQQCAQVDIKEFVEGLHLTLDHLLLDNREKAIALTKLEEVYMWAGKSIRDGVR